jgi:hypothetical protein
LFSSFARITYSRFIHLSPKMCPPFLQNDEGSSQIRIRVIAGKSLAKKDIFGASDPYVRIDLNTINGDVNIDSVLTKTKKKVSSMAIARPCDPWRSLLDPQSAVE